MKYVFDENLSTSLVRGLKEFGEDVNHITEFFPQGTVDEEWLKFLGKNKWYLITRDKRIHRRPIEKDALKRFGVGSFFLQGKNMSRWELVRQVIIIWHRVIEKAESTQVPFAYQISRSGRKIERIMLD
jgi:hypothetical protein